MSSLKTNIEELKARIAVLIVATHSNGAHGIALDAFENVKNIEQKIAKVNSIFFEAYDLIDEAKEKLESIQSSDIEVANAPEH